MNRIWVVMGQTGAGRGSERWVLEAYATEGAAGQRVKELHDLLAEMAGSDGNWLADACRAREKMIRGLPRGDPNISIQTSGAWYSAEPCPLLGGEQASLTERLLVLALAIALNTAILVGIWAWAPGRFLVEKLYR